MPRRSRIDKVKGWIAQADRVVVLTGAGISTDSGIPDFRGPKGLWTTDPKAEARATLQNQLADPALRAAAWRARLEHPAWTAHPNRGHLALVTLEHRDKLHTLITQNVDELHQMAGNSPEKVIEVHGSMRRVMCWGCGRRTPMQAALERVHAGEADPHCESCGGILESDTIAFGQAIEPDLIMRAMSAASDADLLLAVGSTLQVYPVAAVVPMAKEAGARVVIVNNQPTPLDELADLVLRRPIGEVLPVICAE